MVIGGWLKLENGNNMLVANSIHMVNYVLCENVMVVWVHSILGCGGWQLMWETTCNYCTSFYPTSCSPPSLCLCLCWLLWLVLPLFCSTFEGIVVLIQSFTFSLHVCWLLPLHSWTVALLRIKSWCWLLDFLTHYVFFPKFIMNFCGYYGCENYI